MKFENIETENAYMELYKEFGYFHINYGYNHIVSMEDVENARELLKNFDKYFEE